MKGRKGKREGRREGKKEREERSWVEKTIEEVVLMLGCSLPLQYSFLWYSMEREFEKHLLFETKSNNQIRYGCLGETSLSEYYIHNQGILPDTLISSSSVSLLGHGIRCYKHACHGGSGLELGCGYVGPLWMVMCILTMRWQSSPSKWPLCTLKAWV